MKKWRTGFGLLTAFSILAGNAGAQSPAPLADITEATPAMWRVADEDSEFILLGTFHILPPNLNWRTPFIAQAMEEADSVYFEVDVDSPETQSKTIGVVMTQGFLPAGESLSTLLGDADVNHLHAITQELGLPMAGIDPMRPWNAFLTLTVQFIVKKGFDPGAGVDSALLAEAKTRGKKLIFLETIDEQLKFFTGLDPETEKDLLTLTIRDWENQKAAFDDLFKAWAQGDAGAIDEQMNESMRIDAPDVFDSLIVRRNITWAEILDEALSGGSGKALVAVGAGHLVGDEVSVPALLKAKGYDVSRYGESAPAITEEKDTVAAGSEPAPARAGNGNGVIEPVMDDASAGGSDLDGAVSDDPIGDMIESAIGSDEEAKDGADNVKEVDGAELIPGEPDN